MGTISSVWVAARCEYVRRIVELQVGQTAAELQLLSFVVVTFAVGSILMLIFVLLCAVKIFGQTVLWCFSDTVLEHSC